MYMNICLYFFNYLLHDLIMLHDMELIKNLINYLNIQYFNGFYCMNIIQLKQLL